jgi:hypothetical protein
MALELTLPLTERSKGKVKANPLEDLSNPDVSRKLRLPDFNIIGK